MIEIAPSILSADFARLGEQIGAAERGGATIIHVDVMDGHFVPNITLGLPVIEAIHRATPLPLDVHLMIDSPSRYVRRFVEAGAAWLTIHLEADRHPHRTLSEIRAAGARAGLALNPGTPVAHAAELLEDLDLLLVMSVNPGFGGQSFIPAALRKVREARALINRCNRACELEVDGGIKLSNAPDVIKAGASVIVAGSFVYADGKVEANVRALRTALHA